MFLNQMSSQRSGQQLTLMFFMVATLLILLGGVLLPHLSTGFGGPSGSAIRNVRMLTASLEMYPIPRDR